jgi:hypothetical protein
MKHPHCGNDLRLSLVEGQDFVQPYFFDEPVGRYSSEI